MAKLKPGFNDTVEVHMLRRNGILVKVFTDHGQCLDYLRANRKNSEFWKMDSVESEPHGPRPKKDQP